MHECVGVCLWCGLTQAVRAVYGEAHENDVSVWIGERSQPVIVLLTCCVPESQLHLTHTHTHTQRDKGRAEKRGRRTEVNIHQQNFHVEAGSLNK